MIENLEKTESVVEPEVTVSGIVGTEARRLALHSAQYLAGLVGSLVLGLVSFPIFTRIFSVAEYGILDLAQKIVLLLTVLAKGGLQNAVVRFYDEDLFRADARPARRFFSTMVFGVSFNSAVVGLLFVNLIALAGRIVDTGLIGSLTLCIAGLALLRALGSVLWAFLRIEERTVVFNVLTVGLRAATILVVLLVLLFVEVTARGYLTGVIVTEAALVGGLVFWLWKRGVLSPQVFDRPLFRAGMAFGMPLVLYEFGFTALGSADRFLVQQFLGAEALGIYSVASGLSQHANDLLLGPLMLALSPIYMKLWTAKGAEPTAQFLSFAMDAFLAAGLGILAVSIVTAGDLVVVLASGKYSGAEALIPWLLGGLLIFATHIFLVAGLMIHKRTLEMAKILAVAACVNIGLNCLLLPWLGLLGGAFATVLSYLFCILALNRASRRYLSLEIHGGCLAKYCLAAVIACLAAWNVAFSSLFANLFLRAIWTVTVYIAVLWIIDPRVRRLAIAGRGILAQYTGKPS